MGRCFSSAPNMDFFLPEIALLILVASQKKEENLTSWPRFL